MDKDRIGFLKQLDEASMAFQLEDGSMLVICQKDIDKIVTAVELEVTVRGFAVFNEMMKDHAPDGSVMRAKEMQQMLATHKDMSPDIKDEYHKAILELLKNK